MNSDKIIEVKGLRIESSDGEGYFEVNKDGSIEMTGESKSIDFSKFKSINGEYPYIKSLENRISELEKEIKYVQMELKYNYLTNEDMDKVARYINEKTIENLKKSMN